MPYIRHTYILFFLSIICSFNLEAQSPITFDIESDSGPQNSEVCVDITVEDFDGVVALEWFNRFDPDVLRFVSVDVSNSAMNDGGANLLSVNGNFNTADFADGLIKFVWFDINAIGVDISPGDILYTLCFELIGDPCESSDVAITPGNNGIVVEVALENDETIELPVEDIILNPGTITIDPSGFVISETHCSTDDLSDTGSITFSGTGGTGPYSWTLTGNGVNESGSDLDDCEYFTVNDLGPGSYSLVFTDSNNVIRNETIEIVSSSDFPFVLTLAGHNPSCFDKNNGFVYVDNIEGGDAPFAYEWSTFQFVPDTIDKLLDGAYSLTITDVNGCTTSASQILEVDTLKVAVDIISGPSCDGSENGVVSLIAEGGTPYPNGGYDFDVSGTNGTVFFGDSPAPTNPYTLTNYKEGCYEIIVSDDADPSCFSDPVEFCLEEGSFSEMSIDVTDITCFEACNGEVIISASDMGNFSFMVTDPDGAVVIGNNTNIQYDVQGLCPGQYDVTVNDSNAGCTKDTSFVIAEPLELVLMVQDSMGPGCGGGDGMISFSTSGGTTDYTYIWNDAYDQPSRVSMSGGMYGVTVVDANGCRDSIEWTFADGGDIGLNALVCQAVSCGGEMDGSVCANVTATGSYTFTWEDEDGNSLGSGDQIDNLGGGTYFVTATDGTCTDTESVILAFGQTPSVTLVQSPPTCVASNDGMITATLFDGVSPAMYEWTEPPSTTVLSNGQVLMDGIGVYNLHLIDANGCEMDTLVELLPPTNIIEIDITNLIANECFGSCEGSATFTASGGPAGTGDYTFFFENNVVNGTGGTVNFGLLCAGDNFVLATDGVCLSDTFFFNVPDATPIMIDVDASTITPPGCDGDLDGSIDVVISGGNPSSYSLLWINEGVAGASLSNISAGEYVLEITDGNGCIVNDTVLLETFDPLVVSVNPLTTIEIDCFADTTGRIEVNVDGGNQSSLTFDWTPNVSSEAVAENLGPGLYTVLVTDGNGCTAETSYELVTAAPISIQMSTPAEPDCFGGQTCLGVDGASGGVGGPYTFTIRNGPRFPLDTCINLFADTYLITVNDAAGCPADTLITIGQPSEITVDAGPDITIDLGQESDPVSAFIVSELDIDSILWTPFMDVECNTADCQIVTFSPNNTTSYTVTVIDENGCLATDDILVTVDLARHVYTPNIFSPNNDNRNDFFQLATGNGVEMVNYLRIYDRWGNLIFRDSGYMPNDIDHKGWDGTRNGTDLEPGVYVFVAEVRFEDNVTIQYKGDVTLVR